MTDVQNPYREAGKYHLVDSYCVFVDILGFSSEIIENSENGTEIKHFEKLYKTFIKATETIRASDNPTIQTKIFSDNILIGAPIRGAYFDDETQLGTLALYLKYLQLDLTLNGYFLRGGWSIGKIFIDEDFIYGKGLLDAYKIEQTTNFPRIEISEEIKLIIDKHFDYYTHPENTLQNTHLVMNNGKIFINYLHGLTENGDSGLIVDIPNLIKHKNLIEERLDLFNSNSKIKSKYEWCAEYHNFFIEEFLEDVHKQYKIENIKLNTFWKILDKE